MIFNGIFCFTFRFIPLSYHILSYSATAWFLYFISKKKPWYSWFSLKSYFLIFSLNSLKVPKNVHKKSSTKEPLYYMMSSAGKKLARSNVLFLLPDTIIPCLPFFSACGYRQAKNSSNSTRFIVIDSSLFLLVNILSPHFFCFSCTNVVYLSIKELIWHPIAYLRLAPKSVPFLRGIN